MTIPGFNTIILSIIKYGENVFVVRTEGRRQNMEDFSLTVVESLIRLSLAFVLGGLIGWEREKNNRPAGFRTHILVAMSSCLAMLINYEVFETFKGMTNLDPGRMGSYVISGIGFLGAGTIIREGASVKGLTTAASLWASACLGLSVGAGLYPISIFMTFTILFVLLVMNKVEFVMSRKRLSKKITADQDASTRDQDDSLEQSALYLDLLKEILNNENIEITVKKSGDHADHTQIIKIKK